MWLISNDVLTGFTLSHGFCLRPGSCSCALVQTATGACKEGGGRKPFLLAIAVLGSLVLHS